MRRNVLMAVVVGVGMCVIHPPGAAEGKGVGGTITGQVQFTGTPPARAPVKMRADPTCQQKHAEPGLSEEVMVNENGTLRNVFVYVKEGLAGSFPGSTTPVVLDQDGCRYRPRVVGLQVNQPLEIRNSDATLHNVNVKPTANPSFNIAQPVAKMKTTKKFAKPEVMVKFKCNVHPWMGAYAGVLEHPFFGVSNDSGSASLSGLPAGTYIVEVWHEMYGTQVQSVTLGDGESTSIEFSYQGQ